MDFQDVVRKRRMVRSFLPQPLPNDVVQRILANAQRAPSAGFSQGWAFLALEGTHQTEQYWAAVGPDDRDGFHWPDLYQAPLLVVCLSDKDAYLDRYAEPDKGWADRDENRWPVPYWDIDTGFASLLMLLTAVDEGLGACFFGIPPDRTAAYRAEFGVPAEYTPIGAVSVGYRAADHRSGSLKRGRRPVDEVVHRGQWSV